MKFPFVSGGKGLKQPVFEPNEPEKEFIQKFLDDRQISFMNAKAEILAHETIPEARREPLSNWLREKRAMDRTGGRERLEA